MIDIKHLRFSYRRRQRLFENLNLLLTKGSIYGLLGKNGTGKTTLLKLILGVLYPNEGSILVMGMESKLRLPQMLENIFYLPEEFTVPSASVAVYEQIHGAFYPSYDSDLFYQLLEEFEVPRKSQMDKLSFGQKKKVLLSFGIACSTKILLLDEPTNGLDIPSKSQFRKVMAANLKSSQSVIISTHQVRDLTNLIDSILIIEGGEIIFHHDLYHVSEKLLFSSNLQEDYEGTSIYSEMVPGGYMHVVPNDDGGESDIDLEVLFNAVLKNRDQINQLF